MSIKFLDLEKLHNIYLYIKFNTSDEVRYTKPTYDKLESHKFVFISTFRQYNTPGSLVELNIEFETRMQEEEINQSGWNIKNCVYKYIF